MEKTTGMQFQYLEKTNAELRTMLNSPDEWTPEVIHSVAMELSRRNSIPRCYKWKRGVLVAPQRIVNHKIFSKITRFSDDSMSRFLRIITFMAAITQFLLVINYILSCIKFVKSIKMEDLKYINDKSILWDLPISLLAHLMICLFFIIFLTNLLKKESTD